MPTITRIAAAKKKKNRYHVYVDRGSGEKYEFSVSDDLLVKEQLQKGKNLSEADLLYLKKKDDLDKAMQRVLNFLSYRMRSEMEVVRYLRELEVPDESISEMVERLKELQFLDDQRFAEAYVRTKRDTGKKGPLLIIQELYQKGLDKTYIDGAMQQYSEELQLQHCIRLIEKKQSSYKQEGPKKKQQKLLQFLVQKGFSQTLAYQALNEADLDEDPQEEWDALDKQAEKAWKKYLRKDEWERNQRVKQYLFSRGFSVDQIDKWFEYKLDEYQ